MPWRTDAPAAVGPRGTSQTAAFATGAQVDPGRSEDSRRYERNLTSFVFLGLCVEVPIPEPGDGRGTDLKMSSKTLNHTSAALPVALLLALSLAVAAIVLVKARARKRFCWSQSYERLSGSGNINMPHGVPEPDSGDEVDVVYTSRGGSAFRRYSFIHEKAGDEGQEMTENTCLN